MARDNTQKANLGDVQSNDMNAAGSSDTGGLETGATNQGTQAGLSGNIQNLANKVLPENYRDRFGDLQNRAREFQGRARDSVRRVTDKADPFVRERPYVALGVAAAAGFLLSSLFRRR